MDTLTHGLAGALLARALPPPREPELAAVLRRREVWAGFLWAMFPDLDALLSPLSPDFYITQHRGLTHSFLLLPLWAVLLGLLAAVALPKTAPASARREARLRLILVSGIAVLSHILLDWVTSWGTMFFSPLSWSRYTLDWVFILDLVLSGILAIGLLGMRWARRRGDGRSRWAARAGLAAASLYLALCAERHDRALALARRIPAARAISLAAIPQPLSPDHWLLLADDGKAITASFVDLGKRGRDPEAVLPPSAIEEIAPTRSGIFTLARRLLKHYRSPDDSAPRVIPKADGPLAGRALAEGAAGVFGRFARFPAAREEHGPDGATRVVLRDIRFGYLSAAVDPFTYVVWYDRAGRLISAGFPSERWAQPAKR